MPTHPIASRLIPVSQVQPNPQQVRKDFDPVSLQELKDSIDKRGLISPLAVWQRGDNDYVIIAGERRFRCVSSLGWPDVDCRIWPAGTPPEEVELMSLVENIQRKDLNPVELAKGYKVLSDPPHSLTQEEIAKQTGVERSVITRTLALLEQPQEIQDLVVRTTISVNHVRQLSRIPDEKMRIQLAGVAAEKGWSVKRTEKEVGSLLRGKKNEKNDKPVPQESILEPDPLESVWKAMGMKVEYRGGLVWSVDFTTRGAGLEQPTEEALKKELQSHLAKAFIEAGQMLQNIEAGQQSI